MSADPEKAECANCRFWHLKRSPPFQTRCRRFPHYVERGPGEWCGEHQPKATNA